MLNIFFGDMKDVIFNTSVYFKNVYHDEWITAPLSVEMIADVDKSTVIDGGVIDIIQYASCHLENTGLITMRMY